MAEQVSFLGNTASFVGEPVVLPDKAHQVLGVRPVEDRKPRCQTNAVAILAQQPDRYRMERARPGQLSGTRAPSGIRRRRRRRD